jgi:hypothetical protein
MDTLAATSPTSEEAAFYRTIAWFWFLDYPLTFFEVWKWVMKPPHSFFPEEVQNFLEQHSWLRDRLVVEGGFITLRRPGYSLAELVILRQHRFVDATRKFRKLNHFLSFFRLLPWIRMVAACNSLAWYQTEQTSDIDLFIIVRTGTLWLTRLFLVTPFALLGLRPKLSTTEDKMIQQDPFCFSFFLDEKYLSLEKIQLPGEDPYLASWVLSLVPVYDPDGLYDVFLNQNSWSHEFFPHATASIHEGKKIQRSFFSFLFRVSFFEPWAKKIQMKRLPAVIREQMNKDSCVVVSEQMLKFHSNDRRAFYRDQWKKLLKEEGIS